MNCKLNCRSIRRHFWFNQSRIAGAVYELQVHLGIHQSSREHVNCRSSLKSIRIELQVHQRLLLSQSELKCRESIWIAGPFWDPSELTWAYEFQVRFEVNHNWIAGPSDVTLKSTRAEMQSQHMNCRSVLRSIRDHMGIWIPGRLWIQSELNFCCGILIFGQFWGQTFLNCRSIRVYFDVNQNWNAELANELQVHFETHESSCGHMNCISTGRSIRRELQVHQRLPWSESELNSRCSMRIAGPCWVQSGLNCRPSVWAAHPFWNSTELTCAYELQVHFDVDQIWIAPPSEVTFRLTSVNYKCILNCIGSELHVHQSFVLRSIGAESQSQHVNCRCVLRSIRAHTSVAIAGPFWSQSNLNRRSITTHVELTTSEMCFLQLWEAFLLSATSVFTTTRPWESNYWIQVLGPDLYTTPYNVRIVLPTSMISALCPCNFSVYYRTVVGIEVLKL